jgi:phosphoribosyl 1,2-cyclic phosphodiesterase
MQARGPRPGSRGAGDGERVRVTVCGVRGSTPAAGADFIRYGGNTSCVALGHDGAPPSLILDSGTGIRRVTTLLGGAPFAGAILLGHLHWDHIEGLPFFSSGDHPDSQVDLYMPAQGDAETVLGGMMSNPYFPITPSELRGTWRFHALEPGRHSIEGFDVTALDIPHKGGRSFGYRITDGASTVAYLSDHSPTTLGPGPDGLGEYHPSALALAQGCDVLIHDSQYTDAELPQRALWGHASSGYAVGLAAAAGADRVLLFHHEPSRTDDAIDAIVATFADAPVRVEGAAEETVIELA